MQAKPQLVVTRLIRTCFHNGGGNEARFSVYLPIGTPPSILNVYGDCDCLGDLDSGWSLVLTGIHRANGGVSGNTALVSVYLLSSIYPLAYRVDCLARQARPP